MRTYLFIFFLFIATVLCGQRSDFQSWLAFNFDGELFKKINVDVSPELRFAKNSTAIKSALIDFDASYAIIKPIKLGGNYRFQQEIDNSELGYIANRLGLYSQFNYKISKLRLKYRFLYNWEYVGYNTRENGTIPYQQHRHKISLGYYKKKWALQPALSGELFFQRKPSYLLSENKYRITAGVTYEISKKLEADLAYKYQRELIANNPWTTNIILAKITYSF